MYTETTENNETLIKECFEPVFIQAPNGHRISVCIRDGDLEVVTVKPSLVADYSVAMGDLVKIIEANGIDDLTGLTGRFLAEEFLSMAKDRAEFNREKESVEPIQARGQQSELFRKEIEVAANRHGIDSMLSTPDFIVAEYLMRCLDSLNAATMARERHLNPMSCSDC